MTWPYFYLLATALPVPATALSIPTRTATITVDGRLDEAAWNEAATVDAFATFRPREGGTPQQGTRVRMFRDERNLYLGFEAKDEDAKKIRATFCDRDDMFADDFVGVLLNPFQDRRRGFLFLLNPYGIQADALFTEGGGETEDYSWDAIVYSAGRVNGDGYVVEMSLPFASLRFDPTRDNWDVSFTRKIARLGEQSAWPPFEQARGGLLQQLGEMSGMRGIPVGVTVEAIPELTARGGPGALRSSGVYQAHDGSGPWGGGATTDLGASVKVSRAGIAGDLTVNPDFSQIESDAAQIALNERFALFYAEKRPFFLEGRDTFNTPWQAVYTRSIVDPILGVKLSGKTGLTSFAVLNAVDQSPADSTIDPRWNQSAYKDQQAVSTAVRASSDLSPNVSIGGMFTDKHIGPAWNRTGGLDGTLQLSASTKFVTHMLLSATDHPDGSYQTGSAAKVRFFHQAKGLSVFSWYEQLSPGFRAEAGFLPRVGYRETGAEVWGKFPSGRKTGLTLLEPGLSLSALESTIDTDEDAGFTPRLNVHFGSTRIFMNWFHGWERFSSEGFQKDRGAIGVYAVPARWLEINAELVAGSSVAYFVEPPETPYLGGTVRPVISVGFKPWSRLSFSLEWRRSVFSDDDTADAFAQTFGRRGKNIEFDAIVTRATTQLFLTQAISARVITDYNDIDDRLTVSSLLAYRPGPGTVVYAGYQDSSATGSRYEDPVDRSVFVKLSYLFRY